MAEAQFILPSVSLRGEEGDADRTLGEGLETHGCVAIIDHGIRPEMLIMPDVMRGHLFTVAGLVLESLSRYLGESRSALKDSIEEDGPSVLCIPQVTPEEPEETVKYVCCPLLTLAYAARPLRFGLKSGPDRSTPLRGEAPGETLIVLAGEVLEEWTNGQQKQIRTAKLACESLHLPYAKLYLQPRPDTLLRVMPRRTVQQFREECLNRIFA